MSGYQRSRNGTEKHQHYDDQPKDRGFIAKQTLHQMPEGALASGNPGTCYLFSHI
jgi:hypothetical protein